MDPFTVPALSLLIPLPRPARPPLQVTTEEALRLTLPDQKGDKDFEFDRVFAQAEGQEKVRQSEGARRRVGAG